MSFALRGSCWLLSIPTACAVGCILAPLRGWLRCEGRVVRKKSRNPRVPAVQLVVARIKLFKPGSRPAGAKAPILRVPNGPAEAVPSRSRLRAPPWPHCQISHLRQDARHLHAVELPDERQNVRDELIFHQFANFFLAVPFSTSE